MIRIFVINEDDEKRKSIQEMVNDLKDIKVVGDGRPVPEIPDAVEKAKPHIVLLDAGNAGQPVTELATSIQVTSSRPALIMTSATHDMELVRHSMTVGARDHLVMPLAVEELAAAIRTVFEASGVGRTSLGRIVGFLGCRGGAGNTTAALSIAGAAVRRGLRAVVVDGNLTLGDVSFLLNSRTEITWIDWSKDISRRDVDPRKYLVRSPEGIDILSAPLNPAQAELVNVESTTKMLNALRETHELIVVDIPNNFNEVTLELTECVQELCFVSDPTLTGIKNLKLIWDLVEQLRFPHEKRSVLLNRVQKGDRRTVKEASRNYPHLRPLPLEPAIEKGWLSGETPPKTLRRSAYTKAVDQFLDDVLTQEGAD